MSNGLKPLYKYLKKENIQIDEKEFGFQLLSHPDSNSILAISDALNFFNIENIATRIDFGGINKLPDKFMVLLKEKEETRLTYIEKADADYYIMDKDKPELISAYNLENRWTGIVLLARQDEKPQQEKPKPYALLIPLIVAGIILTAIIYAQSHIVVKSFIIFPILGMFLSVTALKDLFGMEGKIIDNFCKMGKSDCNEIVSSTKWKVFNYIKFSDLSIVFFATQLITNFIFILFSDTTGYLTIQKLILWTCLPIILISFYYQRFVEKKWCLICLSISSILILEIVYLYFFALENSFVFKDFINYSVILIIVLSGWQVIKNQMIKMKGLREFKYKSLRFQRDYNQFKNTLTSKHKVLVPESGIFLGNTKSPLTVTLISNPFCSHCKDAHELINKILEKRLNVKVQLILKTNFNFESEDSKSIFRSLLKIYITKEESEFKKAMDSWYQTKNTPLWLKTFQIADTEPAIDLQIQSWLEWCETNEIRFTPTILINGYEYPGIYDRKELQFFINDLLEDESIN